MAWEKRKGHRYYYKGERVGDRVRKVYLGADEIAQASAGIDTAIRRTKELERERARNELKRLEVADAEVEDFCDLVDILTRAALVAAGYRNRKGEWRRKRGT